MRRRLFPGALVLAVGLAASAHAQILPLRQYTTEGGARALPSAEVQQVLQDRLGYVWAVVYSSGLVRYDGVTMELFTEEDGLRSPAVWDAVEDGAGHLWAASNEGLVVSERPLAAYETGERPGFTDRWRGVPLLSTNVRYNAMAVDREGRLWVAAGPLGLVRYRMEGGRLAADTLALPRVEGVEEPSARSVVARADGSVWAGLRDGAVVRYAGRQSRVVRGTGPWRAVAAFHETADGRLWGGELGGRVWRLDESGPPDFRTVSEDLASTPNAMVSDADGRLYVASGSSGVLVLDPPPRRPQVWTRANGLLADAVNDVMIDAEGNVWLAQSGGLSKLRHNADAFTGYVAESRVGERPILPGPSVGAVLPTPGGPCDVWAGTSGGLACIQAGPPAASVYVLERDGLANDYVNALARDSQGRVWAGTVSGITRLDPPGTRAGAPVLRSGTVRLGSEGWAVRTFGGGSIFAAGTFRLAEAEAVWLAGANGLFLIAGDEWWLLHEAAGLPAAIVHAAAVDAEGRLWVGTRDGGLWRSAGAITPETLRAASGGAEGPAREVTGSLFERVWASETGAPTDQIEALLWAGGTLWTATPAGLFALRPERAGLRVAARLGRRQLGAEHVFSLGRSGDGLWVGTNGGLAELDLATGAVRRRVTRADGLVDNEVWYYGSVRVSGGVVYFGTAKGLSVYRPALDRPSGTVPRVHFREVAYGRGAGGRNEAAFAYAATSFTDEEATRYRTRLVGFEDEWSAPSAEPRTRYTNLPAVFAPRTYRFEVAAADAGGAWVSEPVSVSFRVAPPWWLQWWAFGLYASLVAGGLVLAGRANRARVVRRMQERERIRESEHRAEQEAAERAAAEARARALQAENERKEVELQKAQELEVAFRELQEAQARLVQAEKMASLGQLTAGIAHEIKNPLNFVTNFASLTRELAAEAERETDPDERRALLADIRDNTEKIEVHGRRADAIVRSMMAHARGGGGPRRPVDLNALVRDSANLAWRGLRARRPGTTVDLQTHLGDAVGEVAVVPEDLGRVLINLLDNAFDAVRGADPAVVAVETRREGAAVVIRVADTGSGIPDDVRERIFEPFFTTKPTGEGTGLGLSLSYDIVTQGHGGTLAVERLDPGTAFVITLPA